MLVHTSYFPLEDYIGYKTQRHNQHTAGKEGRNK